MAELTMKFETLTGNQRSRRSKSNSQAPAVVESLEVRSLMTVLLPTGTVDDATPTIAWEAVDNAVSYDLWVTDVEQREVQFIEYDITATNFTPTTPMNLGAARVWVRPTFEGGVKGDWSTPKVFTVQVTPTLTGPIRLPFPGAPNKINETKPTITWDTPPGAARFEIHFGNLTERTSEVFRVTNLTAVLDENGFPFFDENREIVREEKRSFELPNDLQLGSYRIYMRSQDDGGRWTDWSKPLNFEIAPQVIITRPSGPSFQNPPLLEWQAVSKATSYDVFVAKASTPNTPLYNSNVTTGTSFQIPKALIAGDYVFWVRARRAVTGLPEVFGLWSAPKTFSTIKTPVVTGPVGITTIATGKQFVTAARPLVEWTAIDKAARYDVWVELSNGKSPYLVTTATTNKYQFESNVVRGDFTVWIRAVSTTGKKTDWSSPYSFTTTGGAPVITSPTTGTNVVPIPDIKWTPVADAKSYNVHISWIDNDFDYILASGISITEFAPTDPLPTGSYRVWVQAVTEDGTTLPWSAPVVFTVTLNENEIPSGEIPELLAVLLPPHGNTQADVVEESHAQASFDAANYDSPPDINAFPTEFVAMIPLEVHTLPTEPLIEELLEQLAGESGAVEWWMLQSSQS